MSGKPLPAESITRSIIGAFYEVYNHLGYGHLEHVYVLALEHELLARGHRVSREFSVRVMYKGHEIACERLDMVIDDTVVVEAKSTESLAPHAVRQVLAYLRATNLEVGMLLHFGPRAVFQRLYAENRLAFRRGPSGWPGSSG